MAWTQADLDALKSAIAGGELSVRHGDRMATYRPLAEMRQILDMMQAEVSAAAGLPARPRQIRLMTRKGV